MYSAGILFETFQWRKKNQQSCQQTPKGGKQNLVEYRGHSVNMHNLSVELYVNTYIHVHTHYCVIRGRRSPGSGESVS